MSEELTVQIVNVKLKSLGRSLDEYKEHAKESLSDIKSMITGLKSDLNKHVLWEENQKDGDNKKLLEMFDKMQEYIDTKHDKSTTKIDTVECDIKNIHENIAHIRETYSSISFLTKSVNGLYAFVSLILIAAVTYFIIDISKVNTIPDNGVYNKAIIDKRRGNNKIIENNEA